MVNETTADTQFRWGIQSLTFSGGDEVPVPQGSMLIIIGPNRGGKSTALREANAALGQAAHAGLVVEEVVPFAEGVESGLLKWFEDSYPSRIDRDGTRRFTTRGAEATQTRIENFSHPERLNRLIPFLVHRLGTEDRLTLANWVAANNPYADSPASYIHVLQADDALMDKVRSEVRAAFSTDLTINWGGGGQVGFHVGDPPKATLEADRVSQEYLTQLNVLPHLEGEGDGMRSFVGTLLATLCGAHPVLLIDEPEAFLHPPQAIRLARTIAASVEERGRQAIIATHSAEIVRGALEASQSVAVCRLTREGDVNHASLLGSDELNDLWSKPVLKTAGVVNGLFHEGVVACEASADSRFYEALLTSVEAEIEDEPTSDLYFVQAGGKGQLASLARAYRSLNTKTAVIADIDLLRKEGEFKQVTDALGIEFGEIESLYKSVRQTLQDRPSVEKKETLVGAMKTIVTEVEAGELTTDHRKRIASLMEGVAPWSEAKKYGIGKLTGGKRKEGDELLAKLGASGLFLVPKGELEGWWPQGPASDKNEWFLAAMKAIADNSDELKEVREFVWQVRQWFS